MSEQMHPTPSQSLGSETPSGTTPPVEARSAEGDGNHLDRSAEDRLDLLENLARPRAERWKLDALIVALSLLLTLLVAGGLFYLLRR